MKPACSNAKTYNPNETEKYYDWWKNEKFFQSSSPNTFSMITLLSIKTSSFYLNEAFGRTIEDAFARYQRMSGSHVCWIAGTNHAGAERIVAGNVQASHKGKEFTEKIWEFLAQHRGKLMQCFSEIGASADWQKEFFTLDEPISAAVSDSFVKLFNTGKIYRDFTLLRWSCASKSIISDCVEQFDASTMTVPGYDRKIVVNCKYSIRLRIENSETQITINTMRPELLLAASAIGVRPSLFASLSGQYAVHPLLPRRMKIIDHSNEDPVLITPGHDAEDLRLVRKYNLPLINVFNDDGTMNAHAGQFEGMKRFDARQAVLESLGDLVCGQETVEYHRVQICPRTGDLVEMMLKPTWAINVEEAVNTILQDIYTDVIKFTPECHRQSFANSLIARTDHDWSLSKENPWGHQIPAYYALLDENESYNQFSEIQDQWIAAKDENTAKELAAKKFKVPKEQIRLYKDTNTLDPWFAVSILPFAFECTFPLSLFIVQQNSLHFHFEKMAVMSVLMTGKLPCSIVYVLPIVRSENVTRMVAYNYLPNAHEVIHGHPAHALFASMLESLRYKNSIAELNNNIHYHKAAFRDGIPQCGSDALRFEFCCQTKSDTHCHFHPDKIFLHRLFGNKIWNVVEYYKNTFQNFFKDSFFLTEDDFYQLAISPAPNGPHVGIRSFNANFPSGAAIALESPELWILHSLSHLVTMANDTFDNFNILVQLCDQLKLFFEKLSGVYIDHTKVILASDSSKEEQMAVIYVFFYCLHNFLLLLHPIMPFITEELYQQLVHTQIPARFPDSIMMCAYPKPKDFQDFHNPAFEGWIEDSTSICTRIRSALQNVQLKKTKRIYLQFRMAPSIKIDCMLAIIRSQVRNLTDSVCALDAEAQLDDFHIPLVQGLYKIYLLADPNVAVNLKSEIAYYKKVESKLKSAIKSQQDSLKKNLPAAVALNKQESLQTLHQELHLLEEVLLFLMK